MSRKRELPPDPERMNDARARWAGAALAGFQAETGADGCDAVCDLVANLMHWCDRHPREYGTFAENLRRAYVHYSEETTKG